MKRNLLSRWAVLIVMLMGLIAPSLAANASAAASMAPDSLGRASSTLTGVDVLLGQAGDKKQPDSAAGDEALIGVLGGMRADFEDEFGEPADDRDADDFTIGEIYEDIRGFDTVQVYWSEDDVALHIILNASRDWTESRALSQAEDFLPADVDLDTEPEELDGGELLYLGSSDALAEVTDRTTYRDLEVGGRPGDLRVILIPGDGDNFATVDIAIGQGDEYVGGGTTRETPEPTEESRRGKTTTRETPTPTEESRTGKKSTTKGSTADADQYLSDVRDVVDQRTDELNRFYEIVGNASNATDADFEELVTIVTNWTSAPQLDAPAGYEEIDEAYTAMNDDFMNAAVSFATWISDTEANAASLDDMSAYLKSAQKDLATLDSLLTDEGV